MIELSNGHKMEYVIASGALAFDGKGWFWERPLVAAGYIKPELFTVFTKSLTRNRWAGNLRWRKPWECVRPIPGGSVNKIGLTNPGADWWCEKVAPGIDFEQYNIAGNIFGDAKELVYMADKLNAFDLVALEVNPSCPNTGHPMQTAEVVIASVKKVVEASRHPVIVKVSVAQDFLTISQGLEGYAEAISLNSVPWEIAFPRGERSPLWRLEKRVQGGGGGVSGGPAKQANWAAVNILAKKGPLPVIGPSIMEYADLGKVRMMGAKAVSFGAIHLPSYPVWQQPWTLFTNPCKPTEIVLKDMAARNSGH